MKKLLSLCLAFIVCANAQAQLLATQGGQTQLGLGLCRLGTDPVDASRQPNWDTECVVKVPATPVTMMTGSGRQVRCLLSELTPVVVDRMTGAARWVLACGNPIIEPANWVPQGTRICGPEQTQGQDYVESPESYLPEPVPPMVSLYNPVVPVVPIDEKPVPIPPAEPTKRSKSWFTKNSKWVVVMVAVGIGAVAGKSNKRRNEIDPPYILPPR